MKNVPGKKHWRMEVLWEDSTVWQKGWEEIADILKKRGAVRCLSVGFVLADDDKGTVLAASVHGSQAVGITMVPRRSILRKKRLR
jgi:hypothetical protein